MAAQYAREMTREDFKANLYIPESAVEKHPQHQLGHQGAEIACQDPDEDVNYEELFPEAAAALNDDAIKPSTMPSQKEEEERKDERLLEPPANDDSVSNASSDQAEINMIDNWKPVRDGKDEDVYSRVGS